MWFIIFLALISSVLVNFQEGWCDSKGTLEDIKAKLQMRHEGAFKRERAIAYSLAQKVSKYYYST